LENRSNDPASNVPALTVVISKKAAMKKLLLFVLVICLTQMACQPTAVAPVTPSLNGTSWKMILVKDNVSGTSFNKPAPFQNDVQITFSSASSVLGSFKGKTITNDFDGDYTLGSYQTMAVPIMNMTKVAETYWGSFFVDNIRSAQYYSYQAGNQLIIITEKVTLTFEKL
jgi:hypothetical protein